MVQEQPRYLARQVRPGAVTAHEVLAASVRRRRQELELRQVDLGERMTALGHETWSRVIVSLVERLQRTVHVDELLGLALALETEPVVLLTPDPDGEPLSLGLPSIADPIAAQLAGSWIAGRTSLVVRWKDNKPARIGARSGRTDRSK